MGLCAQRLYRTIGLVSLLCGSVPVWADTSTSTTTLTIDPSATSGATITASDENNRSGDVTTWGNAHVHSLGNTVTFGDGAAGNKALCADAADGVDACIRRDDTANLWTVDNPEAGTFNGIVTSSGTSGISGFQVVVGDGTSSVLSTTGGSSGQVLTHQGTALPVWASGTTQSNIVAVSCNACSSGAQAYTGMGFQATSLYAVCGVSGSAYPGSVGIADDDADESDLELTTTTSNTMSDARFINVSDGTDGNAAVLTSIDSDGFTLTWTKSNSGKNTLCQILGVR